MINGGKESHDHRREQTQQPKEIKKTHIWKEITISRPEDSPSSHHTVVTLQSTKAKWGFGCDWDAIDKHQIDNHAVPRKRHAWIIIKQGNQSQVI
jgi:hypothetical protein